MTETRYKSIGVFDSGIGGLTVVRAIMRRMPQENIVYFGDTARVPYGSKSPDVIKQYSIEDTQFLMRQDVKMIVVACNTASSVALDLLESMFRVPIVGVIVPGAKASIGATRQKRIGVIGTLATISSNAYAEAIHKLDKSMQVFSLPCPLFVPLAEEGWQHHRATTIIADEYLHPFHDHRIDTLILGCTHYPILHEVIQRSVGNSVTLIDSGEAATDEVISTLSKDGILNDSTQAPNYSFYVSDIPQKFKELGELFLGRNLPRVSKVHV